MTSISAVEYACRQASEYAESAGVFYCSAPVTNGWEIATAIGTVGATTAAVVFGIVEIIRSRRERARIRVENERRVLNSQFQTISGIMREIVDEFPLNQSPLSNRFHTQVAIYESLLTENSDTPQRIKELAVPLFAKFGQIALYNSVHNCRKTKEIYGFNQRMRMETQILPAEILELMSARLETALSAWHLTWLGADSAVAELEELHAEMPEHEKQIRAYRGEPRGSQP